MSEFSVTGPTERIEPWPEREDYRFPVRPADYIIELLNDSAGTCQQRRDYISGVLGAMYKDYGITRQMNVYTENFASTQSIGEDEVTETTYSAPYGRAAFELGSQIAVHSVTSAISQPELRTELRKSRGYMFRTEFGRLHSTLRQRQYVLHFADELDEVVSSSPQSIKEALSITFEDLFEDMPVGWQAGLAEDFLHGFHATDHAIKQYLDDKMADLSEALPDSSTPNITDALDQS